MIYQVVCPECQKLVSIEGVHWDENSIFNVLQHCEKLIEMTDREWTRYS